MWCSKIGKIFTIETDGTELSKQNAKIILNRLQGLSRKLIYLYILVILPFNVRNVEDLLSSDFGIHQSALYSDWVVFGIMVIAMVVSQVMKRLDLVLPILLLNML